MEKFRSGAMPIDISKELEKINFREILAKHPELKTSKNEICKITKHGKQKRWSLDKKVYPDKKKSSEEPITQLVSFQKAMRLLYITGQCVGLNPIAGASETDVSKMRVSVFNWKFLYCIIIGVAQVLGMTVNLYYMLKNALVVVSLGNIVFYLLTGVSTFLFLHMGIKWPGLMKELANTTLNEYIDPSLRVKCNITCVIILTFGSVEHILFILAKYKGIENCHTNFTYEDFLLRTYPWYYNLGLPGGQSVGAFIQIMNLISTLNWMYSDIFIICMSIYLLSILQLINKKVILACGKRYEQSSHWMALREDYSEATRLVRSFDDVISGIILVSYANTLFFICFQLYNILKNGLKSRDLSENYILCPNYANGMYADYACTVYLGYSTVYLLARSLTLSLIAASINSASLVPATALYNVPSSSFCSEVSRFLNQVHGNKVALSGLQFFYITRELVLSVAGTIITYELVMLQVGSDEMNYGITC